MLEAAGEAKGDVKILAVTVLTSLDQGDLDDLGFQCDVETLVLSRARRALEAGCDGVVFLGAGGPGPAARARRKAARRRAGNPPVQNRPTRDQKRTVDVAKAFANGAATSSSAGRSVRRPIRALRRKRFRRRSATVFSA